MAGKPAGQWPHLTSGEKRQLVTAVFDLQEHHGIRKVRQSDLLRSCLRVALRDLPAVAADLRAQEATAPTT